MNPTKEKIRSTFLHLLEQSSCQEITISEICAYANIARRSFYNHYKNKEEILSEICHEIIEQKPHQFTNPREFVRLLAEGFFTKTLEHHEFISILTRDRLVHIFAEEHIAQAEKFRNFYENHATITMPKHQLSYGLYFFTYTALTLYEVWAKEGFVESPQEMANLYMNLISGTFFTSL